MNILIFTTSFHPSVGGLETHTKVLMHEFLRKGHQVKVIDTQFQELVLSTKTYKLEGVEIYLKPTFFKMVHLFWWCTTLYMPNFSLKGSSFLFLFPFKKLVISHNDFYLYDKTSIKIKLKLILIKLAFQNIAVSHSVANYINTQANIIHNCYDEEIFRIFEDEARVYDFVFLGRLVSQKGCDLLIKACSNLNENFTLNIIGDGPERQSLEKMVTDFGLQQKIRFLGVLQGECLGRALNRHKIMVIPSLGEEGFGIVALEGMACGCKIIAADAGGLSEAIEDFGKLFKMGDQEELEKALKLMLNNSKQDEFNKMGKEVNTFLQEHTKETVAKKYLSHFR